MRNDEATGTPLVDEFGRRVRALRVDAGLTQQQLAEAMTTAGCSAQQSTIGKIENGKRSTSLEEVEVLASILATTPAVLLGGAEPEAQSSLNSEIHHLYAEATRVAREASELLRVAHAKKQRAIDLWQEGTKIMLNMGEEPIHPSTYAAAERMGVVISDMTSLDRRLSQVEVRK